MSQDFDFGIGRLEITPQNTAEFPLYAIVNEDETSPVLIGRPATRVNRPYLNALLKKNKRFAHRAGKLDEKLAREMTEEDRKLFPQHVIVGWENVYLQNGTPLEFSQAACAALFQQLPVDIIDSIRNFFASPDNFRDTDKQDQEQTVKN